MYYIVYGATGWIGSKIVKLLEQSGHPVQFGQERLENRERLMEELKSFPRVDCVINCAGIVGKPNVDWCESHQPETIRTNVIGTLNLADLCYQLNIHLISFATGCIYEYDETHPIDGPGFTEEETPNFEKSFYSRSKVCCEKMIREYSNVLTLRIRMPISDDFSERSFHTKIISYGRNGKVINVPNSVSVLHDLLPLVIHLSENKTTGVLNFVNPGVLSHNEILTLYRDILEPGYQWNQFTVEEQNKILKAPRSNNHLDASKLLALFPNVPDAKDAVTACFRRINDKINVWRADLAGMDHFETFIPVGLKSSNSEIS